MLWRQGLQLRSPSRPTPLVANESIWGRCQSPIQPVQRCDAIDVGEHPAHSELAVADAVNTLLKIRFLTYEPCTSRSQIVHALTWLCSLILFHLPRWCSLGIASDHSPKDEHNHLLTGNATPRGSGEVSGGGVVVVGSCVNAQPPPNGSLPSALQAHSFVDSASRVSFVAGTTYMVEC